MEEIPGENQFIYLPLWEKTANARARWKGPPTSIERTSVMIELFICFIWRIFFLSLPFCHNLSIRDGGNKWPYSSLHRLEIQYKLISSLGLPMLTTTSSTTDSIFHFKTIHSLSLVLLSVDCLFLFSSLFVVASFKRLAKKRTIEHFRWWSVSLPVRSHRQIADDKRRQDRINPLHDNEKKQIECVAYAPMA